jgi:putative glutamine amidotransferase
MRESVTEYKPNILINLCSHGGDDKYYIRHGYVESVMHAGGYPIALPTVADPDYAKRMIEFADGIILPGSITDVNPKYYEAEKSPFFGEEGTSRDQSDFLLLEEAFARQIPVFGICFGHQSLNVFCGGTLYQDVSHETHTNINHRQWDLNAPPNHSVKLEEDSVLHRVFKQKSIPVNSFHHQGVKELGPKLRATGYAPDGLIEAYENINGGHFVLGVQWHPERMWREYPLQLALFKEFVDAARHWHEQNKSAESAARELIHAKVMQR